MCTLLRLYASVLGVWYRYLSSGLMTELHFTLFKSFICNVLGFFSALSTILRLDCRFAVLCHMPWEHWCRFLQIWQMAWLNKYLNVTRCSWLHCWLKRDILFESHNGDKVSWKLKIISVFSIQFQYKFGKSQNGEDSCFYKSNISYKLHTPQHTHIHTAGYRI